MNHSSLTNYVFVGHFLVPLLLEGRGASELETGNIVGWSYHDYANDELTCLGTYTNSSGITKLIAGASDGFVYELDSGTDDDGSNIATSLITDWLTLGTPMGVSKVVRRGFVAWTASGSATLNFRVDIDFANTDEDSSITNDSTGVDDGELSNFDLTGTGELFRISITESSSVSVDLSNITLYFRTLGLR